MLGGDFLKKVRYILSFIMLISLMICNISYAQQPISVYIDGSKQRYSQVPVVMEGNTLVPLRGILGGLGAKVNWDGATKTVTAQLINGNTMVLLRYVSESLGTIVNWHGSARRIDITTSTDVLVEMEATKDDIDLSSIEYIYSETERDTKLEKALIKEYQLEDFKDRARYYYNKVDLNGDGKPEIFAYLVGTYFCGTGGCSAAIFKEKNDNYQLLARFSVVNNPIIISENKTKGYKDIIMNVYGGGIEPFFARLKYNGTTYPSNPSIQPKVEPGTKLDGIAIVADDIGKSPGIELNN